MRTSLGGWARARLAERRAIVEYRQAWRRLAYIRAENLDPDADSAPVQNDKRPTTTESDERRGAEPADTATERHPTSDQTPAQRSPVTQDDHVDREPKPA
jgi:hypothetical protein